MTSRNVDLRHKGREDKKVDILSNSSNKDDNQIEYQMLIKNARHQNKYDVTPASQFYPNQIHKFLRLLHMKGMIKSEVCTRQDELLTFSILQSSPDLFLI